MASTARGGCPGFAGRGWKSYAERSDTPVAAAITRPVQCIGPARWLAEHQLDHAADPRAGGNGDKMGLLLVSHSRPPMPLRMNRFASTKQRFETLAYGGPPFFVNKTTLCNKFATIFLLDYPLFIMLSFIGLE